MVKRYTQIKVEQEVHDNLIKLQALRLFMGERVTLSKLIKEMIEQQPVYNISYEEQKRPKKP